MIRTELDALAATLARLLIGGYFALSGINNLLNIDLAVQEAAEVGIPASLLLVFLVALLKLVLGLLIIAKHHTKIASLFLIVYLAFSTLIFYNPLRWDSFPMSESIFMKNLAILGGLCFLYAHSRGVSLMRTTSNEAERLSGRHN